MSWIATTLGNISESIQPGPFGTQLHNSDYSDSGIPVIMPKDMIDGGLAHEGLVFVPDDIAQKLRRHQAHTNNLLVARKGDVKKCILITEQENGWIAGSDCLKVELKEELCYPKFIYYQLKSEYIGKHMETVSIGATMPSLNTRLLSSIPIMLPAFEIQCRIGDVLSVYDGLIKNNQKQIKLLEEAAQRLYKEWFVDLRFPGHETTPVMDGVPKGWTRAKLEEICVLNKQSLTPDKIPPDVPYIGLEHIPRKDICLCAWGNSSEVTSNKFAYKEKDILFGKIRPYFHKVGFALNNGVTSTDSIIMRGNENVWGLLLMTVSSAAFVDYTYQTCKEGSKMPRADWNQMKAYPVLIADSATQAIFESNIDSITNRIKVLAMQNRALAEARDRLLPKLMKGEIEV